MHNEILLLEIPSLTEKKDTRRHVLQNNFIFNTHATGKLPLAVKLMACIRKVPRSNIDRTSPILTDDFRGFPWPTSGKCRDSAMVASFQHSSQLNIH
jgi:hypothetical protein